MKNIILLTALIFCVASGYGQLSDQYSIIVTIKEKNEKAVAYIRYFTAKGRVLDSAFFKNGSFSFTGHLSQKMIFGKLYFLLPEEKDPSFENSTEILLEPATIKITGNNNLADVTFTGTSLQDQFSELQHNLINVKKKQFKLNQELNKAVKESDVDQKDKLLTEDFPVLFEEKQKILGAFIQKYPSSALSGNKLEEFAGDENINLPVVEPVYNLLSDEIKKMPVVVSVASRIAIAKRTAIGMNAIDFIQKDTSGNDVRFSSFKGKYVLIDFWAGWCVPCRAENPMLVKLYDTYNSRGFEIISVSLDGERERWTKAIIKDNMSWTNVSDLNIFENEVSKQYGIASIPQNILISPEGTIIAKNLRGAALEKKLAEVIK